MKLLFNSCTITPIVFVFLFAKVAGKIIMPVTQLLSGVFYFFAGVFVDSGMIL